MPLTPPARRWSCGELLVSRLGTNQGGRRAWRLQQPRYSHSQRPWTQANGEGHGRWLGAAQFTGRV
eukprot:1500988-Rhodomonas_salina.1